MKVLVVGGAGYIGSIFSSLAQEAGFEVVVYDDLSTGHAWAVSCNDLFRGSILDYELLVEALENVDIVCHFAAKIVASDSVLNPAAYFKNNSAGTLNLLNAMTAARCNQLVFSSTAAVYGNPSSQKPITENFEAKPINPYGESKSAAERYIHQWASELGRCATIFRYFNAAGALPERGLGEYHQPETHLIPNLLSALLAPDQHVFHLFGNDYATHDGTCVRDYVHVRDIAIAHLRALEQQRHGCRIFNLGHGRGYSNLEVLHACEEAVGRSLNYVVSERRLGDPARLITDNRKVKAELGWVPMYSELDTIVSDALTWHRDVLPLVVK